MIYLLFDNPDDKVKIPICCSSRTIKASTVKFWVTLVAEQ